LQRYLDTGERQLDWERVGMPGRTRKGDERSLRISFGEFEHADEQYFVGIIRDVTAEDRRRRQLARHNEYLEEFVQTVSHDLRTPLNVAQGRLQLVTETVNTDGQQSVDGSTADEIAPSEMTADELASAVGDVREATRALDRLDELLSEFLELVQEGLLVRNTEPVDLDQAARTAWKSVDTGGLTLDVAEDLGRVDADESRLRELLENLFANAATHAETASTVRVAPKDETAGFVVADDGAGITPAEYDSVFDPGYTTAESGSGFGLAIVRRIVQAHGWSITVGESTEGGARFEIDVVDPPERASRDTANP
jgi:signal transduction histidine kinase